MEGVTPPGQPALDGRPLPPDGSTRGGSWSSRPPDAGPPGHGVDWPAWMAPVALIGGLVLAAVGGLVVDLPAIALGAKLTTSHTPPGLAIADTFVQDVAFVLAAVFCAQLGGRGVRAWQLGLRPPRVGWRRAVAMITALVVLFIVLNVIWAALLNPGKEKILEQLGSNESTALLLLSAALTCVVAPICEEILFRGFIFTALRSWRGTIPAAVITGLLFGAVHAGSAPVLDLVPLAALGFGLCLLYRYSGSLYPCIVAHSLNNSIAFASLEGWGWQAPVLVVAAFAAIAALVLLFKGLGVITPEPVPVGHAP
jgi:uncharacterized protein